MTPQERTEAIARAESLLAAEETLDAEAIYRSIAASLSPADALPARIAVGVCLARRRQWREAEAHFASVHADFPDSGLALAYLAAVKTELGEFDEARAHGDAAIALSPGEGMVYVKRGELSHRLGLLRQAEADYQTALRLALPDATTRDYCRKALLAVRADLKSAMERSTPAPTLFVRALFRRRPAAQPAEAPLPAGRSA